MSSRQLRKLRQQQELEKKDAKVPEDLSEDDEPIVAKPRANAFAGFASLGIQDDDDDDQDDDEPENEPKTQPAPREPATPAAGKKKPKKKKKKNKAMKPEPAPPEPEMDEIDRALQQLKAVDKNPSTSPPRGPSQYAEELANLLSINTNHLKVLNEMRNLFGRETILAGGSDSDPQANNPRRGVRQGQEQVTLEQFLKGRPGQSIADVLLRGNIFVQGKEHWPKASAGGLTMQSVKGDALGDGSSEFTFAHDAAYTRHEAEFFALVQMYDPMRIVDFLYRHPYHVSSLIQVSKVAKQDQNSALAGDLCERALFTFGRVTLSVFRNKLKEGRARLSFRRPENRQFWLAGYNYIKSLIMKGTFRTALEWAKLFLSLSPADEYGLLNVIPVLAIRARESKWLVDLLDNDLFTSIMAVHTPNREYIKQTTVLARLQLKDVDGARSQLQRGMERLPWLYCALFSALDVDTPKSLWGIKPRNQIEELYTSLYLHETKPLWNNTEATALLKEVAGAMGRPTEYETLPDVDHVELGTARFVYLDNTPSLMALVPHSILHAAPNFDFDPLPPAAEENDFSNEAQFLPWQATRNGLQQGTGEARGAGLMQLFEDWANQHQIPPWDPDIDDNDDEMGPDGQELIREQIENLTLTVGDGDRAGFIQRMYDLIFSRRGTAQTEAEGGGEGQPLSTEAQGQRDESETDTNTDTEEEEARGDGRG